MRLAGQKNSATRGAMAHPPRKTARGSSAAGASGPLVGLPPIAGAEARALVLGSMPGEVSLAASQYYAHPQNAFWKVFDALLGAGPGLDYDDRVAILVRSGVAVWDVVRSCEREGSPDSAIVRGSVVVNDFGAFVAAHPQLRLVVCNGATARSFFLRYVAPHQGEGVARLRVVQAPSTSPAHASMPLRAKIAAWSEALRDVVECRAL